jgi:hypothetical protein
LVEDKGLEVARSHDCEFTAGLKDATDLTEDHRKFSVIVEVLQDMPEVRSAKGSVWERQAVQYVCEEVRRTPPVVHRVPVNVKPPRACLPHVGVLA